MLAALICNLPTVTVTEPERYGPALWPLQRRWKDEEELNELKREEVKIEQELEEIKEPIKEPFIRSVSQYERLFNELQQVKKRIEVLEQEKDEYELYIAFLSII